ncbi:MULTISPECIES: cytochrome P450 [Streptomyces]|uniref:SalC n=1 Tax=Streptomyces albus (strain ATCC 21838 / DSM 41398 / FERM P-419 / JCM 4703 / NBRC 107858) TaxID=1081613 RepID=Q197Y8_STRA4|nr:cytochrome P450 [Streptomyces sp. SCSIO ZS0520]ABG02268.1 SalC [Streptomyces albus]AJE81057.1 SalC [Streptomyces albus]AOU75369.1 SalC [Streptomyces albus]
MKTRPDPPVIPSDRGGCPFDPPAAYARLRAEDPVSPVTFQVAPGDPNGWLVTRHDLVREILADERFSHRNELLAHVVAPPFPMDEYKPVPSAPGSFAKMDAPEHTKYRRLLAGHFTLRRIQAYEPELERLVDETLEEMAAKGSPADLVTDWAEVFSLRSVCSLMDVTPELMDGIAEHFGALMRLTYTLEEFIHHIESMDALIRPMVAERMAEQGEDFFGRLSATGELTEDELVNLAVLTLGGSLDTTPNMLALSTFALLEHPEQLALLRERPELYEAGAVDELLRYLTISQMGSSRCAVQDVELGGRTIKAGQTVVLSLPAANRDPEVFTDPDRLDVTRIPRKHLALGFGAHQCLGQHLARSSMRIGLRKLFDRFPSLRLAKPAAEVPLRDRSVHYGVDELPVAWD